MADEPLTPLQEALAMAVGGRRMIHRLTTPHDCLHAAVVVDGDRRVWYPCRSHEGGVHHFAAHWPPCPAPWCRLPASHAESGTMHDIPGGTVEYHDATGKDETVG